MNIKEAIQQKKDEILVLQQELEILEKAQEIISDKEKETVLLKGGRGGVSWGTVQDKTAIKAVQIEMPVEKESDEDIEIKDALRKFSQL